MKPPSDFPISELRVVEHSFKSSPIEMRRNYMHESQVETFVKAMLELHFEPGVNPYVVKHKMLTEGMTHQQASDASKVSVVWVINVITLSAREMWDGPYWWATPGLGLDRSVEGAHLLSDYHTKKRLWAHPELVAKEEREYFDDLKAEED